MTEFARPACPLPADQRLLPSWCTRLPEAQAALRSVRSRIHFAVRHLQAG